MGWSRIKPTSTEGMLIFNLGTWPGFTSGRNSKRKSKLVTRSDGPFEILERIGPNAYKVDLLQAYGVSATFTVADRPYYAENEELPNLKTKSSQEVGLMEIKAPRVLLSHGKQPKRVLAM